MEIKNTSLDTYAYNKYPTNILFFILIEKEIFIPSVLPVVPIFPSINAPLAETPNINNQILF